MICSCWCPHLYSFGFFLPVPWISTFSCSVVAFNWNDVGLQLIPSMLTHLLGYRSYRSLKWFCVSIWLAALTNFAFSSSNGIWSASGLDWWVEERQSRTVCPLWLSYPRISWLTHSWENLHYPSNWVIPSWLILLLQGQSNVGSSLPLPGNIHPGVCMWEAIVICSV